MRNSLRFNSISLFMASALLMPAVTFAAEEPIYEAEGTVILFKKDVKHLDSAMALEAEESEENAEIVFGENGEVYFFNLTKEYDMGTGDTYIKGYQDGKKIYIDAPVINYLEDVGSVEVSHMLNNLTETDEIPYIPGIMGFTTWFKPVEGNSRIEFDILSDGTIVYNNNGGKNAFGNVSVPLMEAFDNFFEVAFKEMTFTPNPDQELIYIPTERPEKPTEPIFEAEGKTIYFTKEYNNLDSTMVLETPETENDSEIVFGENGEVYFFNLTQALGMGTGDTYVMGYQDGMKIYIDAPIINYLEDVGNVEVRHMLNNLEETDEIPYIPQIMGRTSWFKPVEGDSRIEFDILSDGTIVYNNNGGKNAFGNVSVPLMEAFDNFFETAFKEMKFTPNPGQDLIYISDPNAVEGIYGEAEISKIEYFGINGMPIAKPANGTLCIVKVTYTDSKSKVSKTIVK